MSAVTLWSVGAVSCACLTLDDGQVEICLLANGVTLERRLFADTEAAAQFAIEKMRAYSVV